MGWIKSSFSECTSIAYLVPPPCWPGGDPGKSSFTLAKVQIPARD